MKIAHLLSGGVDSSLALKLLKDQGHDITAYYLKIWLEDDLHFLGDCPWQDDLEYVRSTCELLGIPLKVINMQQEYHDTIVEYALRELKAGRTPSPDVMCNRHVKFGLFFDKIGGEYEKVSSGHYAQIEERDGKFYLKQSPDPVKDQTYFLTYLTQKQLSRILFPIGEFDKNEVRGLAEKYELPSRARKDSQGICFLGKIKYRDFVKFHLGIQKGDIIELETGNILGQHDGYWYYTIGQRQGLGLGGGPWYVAKKDTENNIIYISNDKSSGNVPRDKFLVRDINWIPNIPSKTELEVKLRHGPKKYGCTIDMVTENSANVKLNKTDDGIAPGQFAILYQKNYCFGGGIIELS